MLPGHHAESRILGDDGVSAWVSLDDMDVIIIHIFHQTPKHYPNCAGLCFQAKQAIEAEKYNKNKTLWVFYMITN